MRSSFYKKKRDGWKIEHGTVIAFNIKQTEKTHSIIYNRQVCYLWGSTIIKSIILHNEKACAHTVYSKWSKKMISSLKLKNGSNRKVSSRILNNTSQIKFARAKPTYERKFQQERLPSNTIYSWGMPWGGLIKKSIFYILGADEWTWLTI